MTFQPAQNGSTSFARRLVLMANVVVAFQVGWCEPPAVIDEQKSVVSTRVSIPDDAAPSELRRLIADGKVEVVYDSEPEFEKAGRGWADFHISVQREFRYNAQEFRKGGRRRVKVTITAMKADLELTHLVRLPAAFQSPNVWQGQVLRHEFDHVAVSLDPRALLLLRHLLEHLPPIERTLEPQELLTQERLNRIVNEEIERRHSAVVELIRQNNRLLDKLSAHGTRPVPDRAAFFQQLYSKEHLAEQKFPFVDQVLDLLASEPYQQAKPRCQARDPAAN